MVMVLVLGHISALEFWRTAQPRAMENALRYRSSQGFGGFDPTSPAVPVPSESRLVPFPEKPSAPRLRGFRRSGVADFSSPLHVIVSSAADRTRADDVICHVRPEPFPPGSLARIDGDVFVTSPELSFLHQGSERDFPGLVGLGYELCGSYRLAPGTPRGFRDGPPLTSPESIAWVIEQSGHSRGVKEARKALPYLVSNAHSPMETVVALLLCLPVPRGGRGLPFPEMNGRIGVTDEAMRCTRRRYFECDLLWRVPGLALEYDSDAFHTGSDRIANDAARRNALASMGITVITVGRRQVFDWREFNELVSVLEKRLGKRRRAGRRDWSEAQYGLWHRLTSVGVR